MQPREMSDEQQTALAATALLAKRNEDGSIYKDEQGMAQYLDPVVAVKLLGKIDSYATGQGAFNLLVPVAAVREAGLEQVWKRAGFAERRHKDALHYDVADYMLGAAIIPRLEMQAGETWAGAKARYDASRAAGDARTR